MSNDKPRNTLEALAELDLLDQVQELGRSVAERVTDDAVKGWAEKAITQAEKAAQRRLNGLDRDMIVAGLQPLKRVTPAIGRLGAKSLKGFLAATFNGDTAAAEAALLAIEGASYNERRRIMHDASWGVVDEADQRKRDLAELKRAVLAAGAEAFKAAIPFLLAALARSAG
jgi:hypothetical protein